MLPPNRSHFAKLAAAGAFVALTAVSIHAHADQLAQNLGPVGAHEPILTTVGSQRVIAFYEPRDNHCALNAVVWDNTNPSAVSAARIRVSLQPGQIVHIDNAENKSLNLQCGTNAETLSVVDSDELVAFGLAIQQSEQFMKANASGF